MSSTVQALIIDVDGTLTDGKIYMSDSGELFKTFDIKDGYAIKNILPQYKIIPIVITGRKSKIVSNRCEELGIKDVIQGCSDKVSVINEIMEGKNISKEGDKFNVAYIGDDLIDLPGMNLCRVVGCPADAVIQVKEISNFISDKKGGQGAVRDFIEWLIKQ